MTEQGGQACSVCSCSWCACGCYRAFCSVCPCLRCNNLLYSAYSSAVNAPLSLLHFLQARYICDAFPSSFCLDFGGSCSLVASDNGNVFKQYGQTKFTDSLYNLRHLFRFPIFTPLFSQYSIGVSFEPSTGSLFGKITLPTQIKMLSVQVCCHFISLCKSYDSLFCTRIAFSSPNLA